jgi:penicillin-binding protein 1C
VWVGNLEGDPMRAVSGTSGAEPVWRDLMVLLHAETPGRQPPARKAWPSARSASRRGSSSRAANISSPAPS